MIDSSMIDDGALISTEFDADTLGSAQGGCRGYDESNRTQDAGSLLK